MSEELSAEELALFADAELLLRKRHILEKLEGRLLAFRERLLPEIVAMEARLPPALARSQGRLSRGDNYRGQAYRVLDCPAVFGAGDMLAFRTVALWGHGIGFHLLLSGNSLDRYGPRAEAVLGRLPAGILLAAQDSPWEWDGPGFLSPSPEEVGRQWRRRGFLKFSTFLPPERYRELEVEGLRFWRFWSGALFLPQG